MKQIKGLELFSIKKVVERSLDDLCMHVLNIMKSYRMVAGNMDHYFYLEKHDQDKKDILL